MQILYDHISPGLLPISACLTCTGAKPFFVLTNTFFLATLTTFKINSAIRVFLGHSWTSQEAVQNTSYRG